MVPQRTGKSRHLGASNRACRPTVLLFGAYAGQFGGYRHASVSKPPLHLYHLPLCAAACGQVNRMSLLRYLHLDVFAATAGGGNHLGVVIGADAWTTTAMQRFARWTAL